MTNDLPILGDASLCQLGQQSCGSCCWGRSLPRDELAPVLERNRILFQKIHSPGQLPSEWRLFWHEIVSRRGCDLVWAPLLWLPWIGKRLKAYLAKRMVCAFVAFDTVDQQSVGCMLHPLRHNDVDRRQRNAFRLLRNVDCGQTSYICDGCQRYNDEPLPSQQNFGQFVSNLDWFNYSIVVQAFGARIPLPFEPNTDHETTENTE
jgi:hypothetical protein